MKNKKGFTLVELLAVIVLLGILSGVTVTAILRTRRKANEKLVKSLAVSLKQVGGDVYTYELLKGNKTDNSYFYRMFKNNESFVIELSQLKTAGYLKNVRVRKINKDGKDIIEGKFVSPVNSSQTCDGYLLVKKKNLAPIFEGYVNCPGIKPFSSKGDITIAGFNSGRNRKAAANLTTEENN